ncbi:glucokinase [Paenibacillus sp. J31TS4]|uniref:ROK family protein n=1 Tax=Paenibacillus sp. J31TS4 TaxID=2807195 RepID=UPI001B0CA3D9|nr:ROK family protein [Paenibacillus sp. J31TS4]GIP41454.1 glucokinase [Paenibacillus sp. J31TS4]
MSEKVLGIDIGGTSIKGIVLDEKGEAGREFWLATDATRGKAHIVANVEAVVRELLSGEPDVRAVGVGTAGRVNADTGQIVFATDNLPGWHGFQLKEHLEAAFPLPFVIDNDANTALVGEHWLGAGRGFDDLTMLTLGTGVGGGNMIGGRLVHGSGWNGGEWGHVILVPFGRPCNCGQAGCIEQYLSGTALVRLAQEATGRPFASGHEVTAAYREGDPAVAEVFRLFCRHLAVAVHNIHIGINPQAVLLGGGLIDVKELWWDGFQEALADMQSGVRVLPAELGNQAGAIGAAKLAWDRLGRLG